MIKEIEYNGLEIAIIGMACKFPKSKDLDEFWENLKAGKELISFYTDEELIKAGIDENILKDPNYVKAQGYFEDSEYFDSSFFGYTPEEAEVMDPQTRLFHEYAWKALEQSSNLPDKFNGTIGLFAGSSDNFIWEVKNYLQNKFDFANSLLINNKLLSTLISYKLNLKGPSYTIYTACSTSLVAIHNASQSLLNGECDIALAGGVSSPSSKSGYIYQEGMISSLDGHNRTFDAKASGTVGASGIGVVTLKRLEDAKRDKDFIFAIIKGSSINNDGNRKVGFTVPSIEGQIDVVKMAHQVSEINKDSISYVECHGTATNLGDPVEVEALRLAFNSNKRNICGLGSVKSNIGHTDTAAGVAGFIKTVLCLYNRTLVPSLNYENPNPQINFNNSPFYVNTETKEWKSNKYPLRAGVNSLGIGGTNAHVVLEEAPEIESSSEGREYKMLLISGKTKTALDNNLKNLYDYLKVNSRLNLADASYTLQVGRADFKHRKMLVCTNSEDAVEKIGGDKVSYFGLKDIQPQIVFMFTGQGAQYLNMGRELYENEKFFKEELDKCNEVFNKVSNLNLLDILYPNNRVSNVSNINKTSITQPVVFVFEYALAKLLIHWGIEPDSMIGYSFGEYAVACLSGVFSFEDALKLITLRGQLMESVPEGAMLSVPLSEHELKPHLNNDVSLSIVNGTSCIVGGSKQSIALFEAKMNLLKILCIRVNVSHASHSSMMDSILDDFQQEANLIQYHKPNCKYISGITGNWIDENEANSSDYWTRHIRETVRFTEGIETLLANKNTIFIEVGPGRDLGTLIRRCLEDKPESYVLNIIRAEQQIVSDCQHLAKCLGQLWLRGVKIDWESYYEYERRVKIILPTYEFDKQKFESSVNIEKIIKDTFKGSTLKGLDLKQDISDWYYAPSWEKSQLLKASKKEIIEKNTYLLFVNDNLLCSEFSKILKKLDHNVIEIRVGENFISDSNNYYINPEKLDNYTLLSDTLNLKGYKINRILHFWNLGNNNYNLNENFNYRELTMGFHSIIKMMQTIADLLTIDCRFICIGSNLYDVYGNEIIYPERRVIAPLLITISQEYSGLYTKIFDIEPDIVDVEKIANQLISDYESDDKNRIIAYRNGIRWAESYKQLHIGNNGKCSSLRFGGTYIITGGLGKIGLDVAEFIGKDYQSKIILLGRSLFPERTEWDTWLRDHDVDDITSIRIRLFQDIENSGGQVIVFNCDVSDKFSMELTFRQVEKEFGIINGIFHFAGVTSQKYFVPIIEMSQTIIEEHFRPKVDGVIVLKELLKNRNLDFCLITSSISTVLGGIGFGAYASANMFIDGYLFKEMQENGTPWVVVNLDGWTSSRYSDIKNGQSTYSISDEKKERIELLLSLHERGVSHSVESFFSLNDRIDQWATNKTFLISSDLENNSEVKNENSSKYNRPDISSDYVEPITETEKKIANIWQGFFKYEKIGILDDFFELGGDSLKAMTISVRLQKEFNVRIAIFEFFSRPRIKTLAEYFDEIQLITKSDNSISKSSKNRKVVEL